MKIVLVYQGMMANVFAVKAFNMLPLGREAEMVLQGSHTTCINVAFGLASAGCPIVTAFCNQVGDIRMAKWTEGVPCGDTFEIRRNLDMTAKEFAELHADILDGYTLTPID